MCCHCLPAGSGATGPTGMAGGLFSPALPSQTGAYTVAVSSWNSLHFLCYAHLSHFTFQTTQASLVPVGAVQQARTV